MVQRKHTLAALLAGGEVREGAKNHRGSHIVRCCALATSCQGLDFNVVSVIDCSE